MVDLIGYEKLVYLKKGDLTLPKTINLNCLNNNCIIGYLNFTKLEEKIAEIQKELEL